MNKSRAKLIIVSLPVFVSVVIFFFVLFSKWEYILYPGGITKDKIFVYDDSYDKGHSMILDFIDEGNRVRLKYQLKEGFESPYAGMIFAFTPYFDLRPYNSIELSIRSETARNYRLNLTYYISNYTNPVKHLSSLETVQIIPVWQKKKSYIFQVDKLYVPIWWYDYNHINKNSIHKDYSKMMTLEITTEDYFPKNEPDSMTIDKIRFFRDKKPVFILIFIIISIYAVFLIIIRLIQRIWNKRKPVIISYRQHETSSNSQVNKLLTYLVENYSDPDLSVEKASEDCAIPALKIPQIIKQYKGKTFPQFINSVRIEEAKRLIRETGRSITEIALSVGYNSPNHFNRLFKESEKISPVRYRKDFQK